MGKIEIVKRGKQIFYKTEGDSTEFYDLDSLLYNHPELENDLANNRIGLERILLQQRELKQAYTTIA